MTVVVRYFAAARERAGRAEETVALGGAATVGQLFERLAGAHPGLAPLRPHLRFSLNLELVDDGAAVKDGDELGLIPPVSGGAGALAIESAPLSLDAVVRAVSGPAHGAVVTFTGAVRDATQGRPVVRLEYEAYGPLALKQLEAIAQAASERFSARLAIHHRVGTLVPGELAVVIAAAAPHRAEAFEACRFAIERLKAEVAVWKKEVFADGSVWVGLGP
ncbi:MAG: molybdenum cofactor biosynthesis protein MoaE [Myxococcaceae bacterium]|nr:molybdenum cofactor biosynthesis protein MoaE [Myxococcaceae bacterium]